MAELREKVRRIFDAHRKAYETVGDSQSGAHCSRQRGMRHEGLAARSGSPLLQTLGEREKPAAFQDLACGVDIAAQHSRDDAAVAAVHLLLRKWVLRMTRKAGVIHALGLSRGSQGSSHCKALSQWRCIRRANVLMPRNVRKESNGLETSAQRILQISEPLLQFLVPAHDRGAAHGIRMAVQILRGRMHDNIEAVLEGALDEGVGEGVVAHGEEPMALGNLRTRAQNQQFSGEDLWESPPTRGEYSAEWPAPAPQRR